jgi:hypothetical protein
MTADQHGGCRIRAAHIPHGYCPGSAPEYLSEKILVPRAYVPPSSRDRCAWCRVKATPERPIYPVLGTGESYHAECATAAEVSAGDPPQPVGADAEPGDLYGPAD